MDSNAMEVRPASPFDAIRRVDSDGAERWSARELMPLLGYDRWENFTEAIDRARISCKASGGTSEDHLRDATKIIENSRGQKRPTADYSLTRYACYLVAMNGDPRKPEIAAAQTYFAVKTREAETATPAYRLPGNYAEALRELAATVEERDGIRAELAAVRPSAESWDKLAAAEGDYAVADAAKILSRDPVIKIGRDRLFTLLARLEWIYRQAGDGRWRARQTAVECGRISEIPASHYHPRTGDLVLDAPQIRVTLKGIQYLHQYLHGQGQGVLFKPRPTRR